MEGVRTELQALHAALGARLAVVPDDSDPYNVGRRDELRELLAMLETVLARLRNETRREN